MAHLGYRRRAEALVEKLTAVEAKLPIEQIKAIDKDELVRLITEELMRVSALARRETKRRLRRELIAQGKDPKDFDTIAEDF